MMNLKEQAQRFYGALDKQDWEEIASLVSPSFAVQVSSLPPMGFSEWRGGLEMFYAGFPDGHHVIEDFIVEGDRVVSRCRFEGTHTANFFGVPPSGRKVSVAVIHIDRFTDEKLVEHLGQIDLLGLMQQIGAIHLDA
jgi:predicted ester cyclase